MRGYRQPLPIVVWEVDGEGRSVLDVEGVDEVLLLVVVEGVEKLLPLVDVGGTGSLMVPAAVMGSHLLARRTANVKAEDNNQISNENAVSLCAPHTRTTHTHTSNSATHTHTRDAHTRDMASCKVSS